MMDAAQRGVFGPLFFGSSNVGILNPSSLLNSSPFPNHSQGFSCGICNVWQTQVLQKTSSFLAKFFILDHGSFIGLPRIQIGHAGVPLPPLHGFTLPAVLSANLMELAFW